MIWNAKRVWLVMTLVCAAVGISVAQDGVDEDSLLALEEMTLTDAVEGDLPMADDAAGDDLLAELLGAEDIPADDLGADDAMPLEAMVLDDTEVDALTEALKEVPADALADSIDGIEPEADAFEMPEIGDDLSDMMDLGAAPADAPAEEPFDLDAAAAELGLAADDPEVAVPAEPAADEMPPPADDFSLDDLLGEMAGDEPTAGTVSVAEPEPIPGLVEEAITDTMPAEEKGLDDLFGAEEPGVEDMPEVVEEPTDLDMLIGELAEDAESDLDMGALVEEIPEPAPMPEPVVVEPAPFVEPVAPPPMVEIVEKPEDAGYVDEMALDDDLIGSLINEARSDIAAGQAALAEDAGAAAPAPVVMPEPPPTDVVEMLIEEAETDMGLVPETMPAPPTMDPVAIPAMEPIPGDPVMLDPEPVRLTGKSASVAAFETAERLKRIAGEAHAIESIQNAEKELAGKNYMRAITLFEEALDFLPRRTDLEPARARARTGLGGAYYLRALSLERMNELEKAKAAALNSVKYGYKRGEAAVKRIQDTIDEPPPPPPPEAKHRWEMKDYLETEEQVAEWLKRGREAYLTGEYEEAILAFESVLARDPENKEAIRLMNSAAQKRYDRAGMELDATRKRMMADVRDTWNPRQYGLHEAPIDEKITTTTTTSENEQRTRIVDKMTKIRIPEVDFRQANIRDVVDFLHQQSVEFDPSEDPDERKGVNIILKLEEDGGGGGSAPAEPLDPFAAPDDAFGGGKGGGAGDETLVTFSALDITLKEALDIVVDVAGLKYRIRGSVIIILPKNAAEGEIEHRMYDVLSTAITRLQELSSAVTSERRDSGGDFLALEGGGGVGGEEVDLKAFFTEMGVEWPDNSSIKFVRGLGKLVVANTLENLTVFEKVLSILNVVPYQIEIEARFVEVAQTDVDSLGLEWLLNDNWEILEKKSDAGLPLGARERIVMNANASGSGFTRGNRFLSAAGVAGAPIADDLLSLSAVLTNPELSVVLHALQQRGHTDLLSAPKITTQSGQQATIKVVTEYIYPTEFETEGISGGNNNNNVGGSTSRGVVGAVVTPSSFETREVGVILEVMPEVSPEGQMINLTLSPEVVSEPTWKNYGSSYTSYDPDGNPVTQELNMEQPFFHTRNLRTNLLIYNGATVVMGGMITEVRRDVDDKIPLLGDIPLVGRLFRSRYESSEKRNLLIFVTARLVDPSGRALDRSRFGVDKSIAEKIVAGGEGGE